MARLSITQAARVTGTARSTLQRAIRAGRLTKTPDGTLDTAELLRAGFPLHAALQDDAAATRQDAAGDAAPDAAPLPQDAAAALPRDAELMRREIALLERELALRDAALHAAEQREQQALAREAQHMERIALLLHLLDQSAQQNQRLLEAPRSQAPAPRAPRVPADAWTQIGAWLQAHPGPHHHTAIQAGLGWTPSLRFVLARMEQAGQVRRVRAGVYAAAEA